MKKICGKCKLPKTAAEFTVNRYKGSKQSYCVECNKQYAHERYLANKDCYKERNRKRRKEWNQWWKEFKSSLQCSRCEETYWACLEFHHIDPSLKDETVGRMIANMVPKETILKEIAKCIVLCSNCHRKEHHGECSVAALHVSL